MNKKQQLFLLYNKVYYVFNSKYFSKKVSQTPKIVDKYKLDIKEKIYMNLG